MSSGQSYQHQSPFDTPNPTFSPCASTPLELLDGPHTAYMDMCADQPCQPLHTEPESFDSPAASISGSSARHSSVCSDDDLSQRDIDSPFLTYQPSHALAYLTPFSPSSSLESSLLDSAPPIYSLQPSISYGRERLIFVEKLIWNCVGIVYSIYGEPGSREVGPTASIPLENLVHNGLVHGLCNEIVIQPIMDAIQKLPEGNLQHHQADMIPFPLFMAEMLRRMRASCFLLRTAMRYILDIEKMAKAAMERAKCGWCRSGIEGCDHAGPSNKDLVSRFSRGRKPIGSQSSTVASGSIAASRFSKIDRFSPLADPRKAFLGALILANKFHRDRSVGNKSWATLIGLPLEDVHSAERAVGEALGWTLSRPWISDEKGQDGTCIPGSTHPTYAEPLFATNDQEVSKYGVKILRDNGELPPPLAPRDLLKEMSSLPKPATEYPVLNSNSSSVVEEERLMTTPKPNPLRRHTSDSLTPTNDRKIAPLPARQQSLLSQTLKPLANPIRKTSSAPFVLETQSTGYFSPASSIATTLTPPQEMIQSVVESDWCQNGSDDLDSSSDSFMDETPTLEQLRSKRKANEDFGPKPLLRRCGTEGQPIVISAEDSEVPRTSSLRRHATLPLDLKDQRGVQSISAAPTKSIVLEDAIIIDAESDNDMCPELDATDTPTTMSPSASVGMVTRSNTPANLFSNSPKVVKAGSDWWKPPVNDATASASVGTGSPIARHKSNHLFMPIATQPRPAGLQFQFRSTSHPALQNLG